MMQKQAKIYICSECGKPIEGDHVYIKTKRGTELHIHNECIPRGERREKDGRAQSKAI